MSHVYALAQLSALHLSPPEFIALAAKTGYDAAGIRLLPAAPGAVAYNLMDDAAMLRETMAVINDTGVPVFDLEMIQLRPDFDVNQYKAFFAIGQQIGAKAILVGGADPDEARMTASYATLCEVARPYGLTCNIEFMPWTNIPNAATAMRVARAAQQQNCGILVDGLHFGRSATTLADIASIPREWLHYAQICDGAGDIPKDNEGLIYDARHNRLLPGDGAVDLKGLFAALPSDIPVSVEIVNDKLVAEMGDEQWARTCLARSKALIESIGQ